MLRKFPPPAVSSASTVNRYSEAGEKARAASAARGSQPQQKTGGLLSRITDAAKSAAVPQPGAAPKAVGKGATNGKPAARSGGKSNGKQPEATKPTVDGKALAPKPGAKPVNPKRAGGRPAKRK